jgi:hypothetical protein
VIDNVTGLIWEGKEASGDRSGEDTFTNYADDRSNNASTYVRIVNGRNLCGFSDWRLPSVEELHTIYDHGVSSGPRIKLADFPNTPARAFWASDNDAGDALKRWQVGFDGFGDRSGAFADTVAVRLVRGTPWSGPRYLTTSAPFMTDGDNNAVIDRKTGLTWRRCLEGQRWTGSACTGGATNLTHELALIRGAGIAGWRLPNIKELASLADRSRENPALDSTAFPGHGGVSATWSSSPFTNWAISAGSVYFPDGAMNTNARTSARAVHLVRETP